MRQTFNDLCNEKEGGQGQGMVGFALWAFGDTAIGILNEHLRSSGDNKHMKNTPIVILSLVFLIPFSIIFALGMAWQFLYNLGYASLPDIGTVIPNRDLGFAIIFIFPVLAFFINFVTLIVGAVKVGPGSVLSIQFAKANFATLAITFLSAGAMIFAFGHDSIPCFVHGVLRQGLGNIWPLINICRNA